MAQATQPIITRRHALHLAVGAVAVAAIPAAALANAEPSRGPIERLARERCAILAFMNGEHNYTDEEIEPFVRRLNQIDTEITATEARRSRRRSRPARSTTALTSS